MEHPQPSTPPVPPPGYGYPSTSAAVPRYRYPASTGTAATADFTPSVRGMRGGAVVALAAASALVAGLLGGLIGYAASGAGSDRDAGFSLIQSSTGTAKRPPNSVAGVAADVLPTVVSITARGSGQGATGSGFVLRDDGYILTNNHVVAGAAESGDVVVSFIDGSEAKARIVGRTAVYDLAVLKVDVQSLPTVELGNSSSLVVGDPVIAVGSPLGLSGTVTTGIVSALDRPVTAGDASGDVSFISAIQTDAAINPGNSGGPLVDARGRVVGVNSSIATLSAGRLAGNIGLGFAIPINQARRIAEELIADGVATYPIVGVNLDVTFRGPGARILPSPQGDRVPIIVDGPADQAGMIAGDVVVAVNGDPVAGYEEFVVAIRAQEPGDQVSLTIERGDESFEVDVTLGSTQG